MAPPVAHLAFHAVNNHVIGYTLQEQAMAYVVPGGDADALARSFLEGISPDEFPHTVTHVRQHLDGDTAGQLRNGPRPDPRRPRPARPLIDEWPWRAQRRFRRVEGEQLRNRR